MKASTATVAGIVLVSILSILYLAASQASAQAAITADNVFPTLVYSTATGPTSGESVFIIRNPFASNITLANLSASLVSGPEATIELFSVTNHTETREHRIPNGYLNITTGWHLDNQSNNVTEWGLTTNYTIETESVMVYDFAAFEPTATIAPGQSMLIGVRGHWKAALGPQTRDWVPRITVTGVTYEQDRFAFWNTSYNYSLPFTISGIATARNFTIDTWFPVADTKYFANLSDIALVDPSETFELDATIVARNSTHVELVAPVNVTEVGYTYFLYYGTTNATQAAQLNRSKQDRVNITNSTVSAERYYISSFSINGGTPAAYKENSSMSENWGAATVDYGLPRVGWFAGGEIRVFTTDNGGGVTTTDGVDNSTFANRTVVNGNWRGEYRFYPSHYTFTLYTLDGANKNYTMAGIVTPLGTVSSSSRVELANGTVISITGADAWKVHLHQGTSYGTVNWSLMYDSSNEGRAAFMGVNKAYQGPVAPTDDVLEHAGGTTYLASRFGVFDTNNDYGTFNSTGTVHRLQNSTGNIFFFGFASRDIARNMSMLLGNDSALTITPGQERSSTPPPPPSAATEPEGLIAMRWGVNQTNINGTSMYDYQQIVTVNATGNQSNATFDLVVENGNQTWAFNYNTTGERFANLSNISSVFLVWENSDLTAGNITAMVSDYINRTKV